jgi:hypothetical protein
MSDDQPATHVFDAADGEALHGPVWHRQAVDASWALAARDAAIEAGDRAMAARFAAEARDAIAAAVDAGATPAELAWELDYPGGHEALDGPHIDRQINHLCAEGSPARTPAPPTATSLAEASAAVAAAVAAADRARGDAARQDQLARWDHNDHAATAEAGLDYAGLDRTGPDDEWAR